MGVPVFLLLGGNKLNFGILQKFKKKGCLVAVVDWNEHPQLMGDRHYKVDIKDYKSIIKMLKFDRIWEDVILAYSSIDVAVQSVACLNRAIGLHTISDDGLQYATSKSMMTKKWNEIGILNRLSKCYSEYDDTIEKLSKEMKLIIKPDNSASSRGITIIAKDTPAREIRKAFHKAYEEATDYMVVVEEYIDGTEFTVEMLGDDYGNVCVYGISRKSHTQNAINNKIAVKLHYNAVSDALQEKIAQVGIQCYKSLGFSASLGHLEVLLKEDGTVSPIEIGARSSGFIASDLIDIVSGSDYLGDLVSVQKGASVREGLHWQTNMSSMYFFYDFPDQSEIKNECSLLDFCDPVIKGRYCDRSNIVMGQKFSNIDNDNERYGFEILEGPRELMTIVYIDLAEKKMLQHMLQGGSDDL